MTRDTHELMTLIKREPLNLRVAHLIKEVRQAKVLTQEEVCARSTISRQYLSELENGYRRAINLKKVEEIINACGEQLFVTTSYTNPLQISDQTQRENQVLQAFAEGRHEEAEMLLAEIRSWRYPTEQIMAKCKRNIAVALSLYFKGLPSHAHGKMNKQVMGLACLGCDDEVEYVSELYFRVVKQGKRALAKAARDKEKGGKRG